MKLHNFISLILLLLVVFICMMFGCSIVKAATYYVTKGGSDANAGTSLAAPFLTIDKANTTISGGDTILVGAGVYREPINAVSGTANTDDGRTFYIAMDSTTGSPSDTRGAAFLAGQVSIWGSDSVSGWVSHSGNIYKAAWTTSNVCQNTYEYVSAFSQFDGSNERILWPKASLGAVTTQGHAYYDTAVDTLYVWLYGNADPTGDTVDVEASCVNTVLSSSDSNFTFYGFDLRNGSPLVFKQENVKCNYNSFIHCNFAFATNDGGSNAALLRSDAMTDNDSTTWHAGTRLAACSLSEASYYNVTGSHVGLITWYTQIHFIIDSCYFVGGGLEDLLSLKGHCQYGFVRFNTFDSGSTAYSVWLGPQVRVDSIYGNIFDLKGNTNDFKAIQIDRFNGLYADSVWILNNTFYNVYDVAFISGIDDSGLAPPAEFKYNIVSEMAKSGYRGYVTFTDLLKANAWSLDSNMYYDTQEDIWDRLGTKYYTIATWRGAGSGHDSNSVVQDPGFNNAANGDFARPSASGEMNQTYGGQTWTIYGAVQNSANATRFIISKGSHAGTMTRVMIQ